MTDKTQLAADYAKKHFSFLCILNEEGELIDAFMNLKTINNSYTKVAEDILQSGSDNVIMCFQDLADQKIVGALHNRALKNTHMVTLDTDEMVQTFPWWFMDDDGE